MRKVLALASLTLALVGCSDRVEQAHENYLQEAGWTIKAHEETDAYIVDVTDELQASYEAANIQFLNDLQGEEVEVARYTLEEKEKQGEHIVVMMYSQDDEILGAIGHLPSWSPGLFNIQDKQNLMKLDVIEE